VRLHPKIKVQKYWMGQMHAFSAGLCSCLRPGSGASRSCVVLLPLSGAIVHVPLQLQ
jgi:hypothetical protein